MQTIPEISDVGEPYSNGPFLRKSALVRSARMRIRWYAGHSAIIACVLVSIYQTISPANATALPDFSGPTVVTYDPATDECTFTREFTTHGIPQKSIIKEKPNALGRGACFDIFGDKVLNKLVRPYDAGGDLLDLTNGFGEGY